MNSKNKGPVLLVNALSPNTQKQILPTDLYIFP